MREQEIFLTPQGAEKLTKELEHLKTEKRREITEEIERAKDYGDLTENFEYTAAKEEQGRIEQRIFELEQMLRGAEIVPEQETEKKDIVWVGTKVTAGVNGQTREYQIVGSFETDPLAGKISNASPLGRAFLGKKVGDTVEVQTPAGPMQYQILAIQ